MEGLDSLWQIFLSGRVIWALCGGAMLCILIDSIWPQKMASLVYFVGILSLVVALYLAFDQWGGAHFQVNDLFVINEENVHLIVFFFITVIAIGILTLLNALGYLRLHQNLTAEFSALVLFAIVGMIVLVISDHLILSFIGLETMSLSIYVLVGSHKKNIKSNEAAVKYYVLGSAASAILLFGIVLLYGGYETFRLSALASQNTSPDFEFIRKIALSLVLVGLFFKLAIVPFHFWAPDVYQGAPAPVTGFMATGVKVAAFAFTIRIFMAFDILDMSPVQHLLEWVVVLTFFVGNLAAIAQDDVKRMLAYSSVAHAGFLLFGVLAGFEDGHYNGANANVVFFYLFGYFFMTLGAFAFLSLLVREKEESTSFGDLAGLGHKHPILAGVFGLFMLSMLGLPGTVGFAAKYGIIALAVHNGHIVLAILAVIVSVISAFYYLRPIAVMFFLEEKEESLISSFPLPIYISLMFCLVGVLYLGLFPNQYLQITTNIVRAVAAPMVTLP